MTKITFCYFTAFEPNYIGLVWLTLSASEKRDDPMKTHWWYVMQCMNDCAMKPSSKRRARVALSHGWHHESISSWQGAVAVQTRCWCAPGAGAVAVWCWGSPARGDTTLAFGDGCSSLVEQTSELPLKPGGLNVVCLFTAWWFPFC